MHDEVLDYDSIGPMRPLRLSASVAVPVSECGSKDANVIEMQDHEKQRALET